MGPGKNHFLVSNDAGVLEHVVPELVSSSLAVHQVIHISIVTGIHQNNGQQKGYNGQNCLSRKKYY